MKTILITGASSGFGRDTATLLAKAGHKVFAGMRDLNGRNATVAAELRSIGITPLELDVTRDASVTLAIVEMLRQSGNRLDVVVNNAGIASAGVSEAFTPEQLRDLFEVNVIGVQRVLRATLPTLRQNGAGLAITIGSILGRVTFPFFGLYGASKFALEAMMDSYRYELSKLGIDVVLVQPSAYPTGMYAASQQPADAALVEAYGDIGQIPGKMFETFMTMFQSDTAPDPQDVGKAIAQLVETPAGKRPGRVVVGNPYGADAVNSATAPIQTGVVNALGLGFLETAVVL